MFEEITFREVVWLFCPAFGLHILEEWPCFTSWARVHGARGFRQRDYNVIHLAGLAGSLATVLVVRRFPHPALIFLFFAFVFAPSTFFNTLFHTAASWLTKSYCPGMVTALVIYLPLFFLTTARIYKEGLLSGGALLAALAIAGVFHLWEVGHNVFKVW